MTTTKLFLSIKETRSSRTVGVDDLVLTSWVLDAVRKVFGLQDRRREILKYFIPNQYHPLMDFGDTFGSESRDSDLHEYMMRLVTIHSNKRLVLFTASNTAKHGETHYQTFVVDRESKRLWVIDPASVMGQPGIYQPYIAMNVVIPFFSEHGYVTEFVKMRYPCQSSTDDVFCQTWSLFLQIQFVITYLSATKSKRTSIIIPIPQSPRERYRYLIAFYKQSCRHLGSSGLCRDLREIYDHSVSRSRYLVVGISDPSERKKIRAYFKAFDPCEELMKMNELDLMTEDR